MNTIQATANSPQTDERNCTINALLYVVSKKLTVRVDMEYTNRDQLDRYGPEVSDFLRAVDAVAEIEHLKVMSPSPHIPERELTSGVMDPIAARQIVELICGRAIEFAQRRDSDTTLEFLPGRLDFC